MPRLRLSVQDKGDSRRKWCRMGEAVRVVSEHQGVVRHGGVATLPRHTRLRTRLSNTPRRHIQIQFRIHTRLFPKVWSQLAPCHLWACIHFRILSRVCP